MPWFIWPYGTCSSLILTPLFLASKAAMIDLYAAASAALTQVVKVICVATRRRLRNGDASAPDAAGPRMRAVPAPPAPAMKARLVGCLSMSAPLDVAAYAAIG